MSLNSDKYVFSETQAQAIPPIPDPFLCPKTVFFSWAYCCCWIDVCQKSFSLNLCILTKKIISKVTFLNMKFQKLHFSRKTSIDLVSLSRMLYILTSKLVKIYKIHLHLFFGRWLLLTHTVKTTIHVEWETSYFKYLYNDD